MLKLRATRRTVALAASTVALAASATIATGGSAFAAGANWQAWTPDGNCFGYTLWNANQVTGYVVPHNGATCSVDIYQSTDGGNTYSSSWWSGWSPSPANTPTWWHGYASNGSILTDRVCISDGVGDLEYCSGFYN